MIKKLKILLLICLAIVMMVGCQNEIEGGREEELGFYSFGHMMDEYELFQIEYNGDLVRIPYHVEGLALTIDSEFG